MQTATATTMTKNPRFKVVRFEEYPNDHPESSKLWPSCTRVVLECGCVHNLGAGNSYRPKRMACYFCGDRQRAALRKHLEELHGR